MWAQSSGHKIFPHQTVNPPSTTDITTTFVGEPPISFVISSSLPKDRVSHCSELRLLVQHLCRDLSVLITSPYALIILHIPVHHHLHESQYPQLLSIIVREVY